MSKFSLRRDGKSKAATKIGKGLEIWYNHWYKVSTPRDEQKKALKEIMAELFSLCCAVTENLDQLTKIYVFQKIEAESFFSTCTC